MQFLYQTVKEILSTGRIGTPVFVRCVVQIGAGDGHLIDPLARMLMITGLWLEATPFRIYAQSRYGLMQITASVQYTGGQTAIVSVSAAPGVSPRVDLMVLGNKGALYQDGTSLPPGFDMAFEPVAIPEWLIDALERSLLAGKPTIIEEVTDFE